MILDEFGDEMEKVFEKTQFLRVTTYFLKNVVKHIIFSCDNVFFQRKCIKRTFLRMTTYFFKENVDFSARFQLFLHS